MFSEMITELQKGHEPAPGTLRLRLQAAMVKKLAMMRLRREFHHNDSKINPVTEHMLWAATLLENHEAMETLVAILITESHDRFDAQQGSRASHSTPPELVEVVNSSLNHLLTLSPDKKLNHLLKQKIKKASLFKELSLIIL